MVNRAAIRKERLKQGRTQAEVAKAADLSRPVYSRFEAGSERLSREAIERVCDVLGLAKLQRARQHLRDALQRAEAACS